MSFINSKTTTNGSYNNNNNNNNNVILEYNDDDDDDLFDEVFKNISGNIARPNNHGDGDGDGDGDGAGDGDGDGDGDDDEYILDDSWIREAEENLLSYEYSDFIKEDITNLNVSFIFINRKKEIEECRNIRVLLRTPNQITQTELIYIIQKNQWRGGGIGGQGVALRRTYYNFYRMICYSFYMSEDAKTIATYLNNHADVAHDGSDDDDDDDGDEQDPFFKEYESIISPSTEIIYFHPTIRLFHDISSLTIILHED